MCCSSSGTHDPIAIPILLQAVPRKRRENPVEMSEVTDVSIPQRYSRTKPPPDRLSNQKRTWFPTYQIKNRRWRFVETVGNTSGREIGGSAIKFSGSNLSRRRRGALDTTSEMEMGGNRCFPQTECGIYYIVTAPIRFVTSADGLINYQWHCRDRSIRLLIINKWRKPASYFIKENNVGNSAALGCTINHEFPHCCQTSAEKCSLW